MSDLVHAAPLSGAERSVGGRYPNWLLVVFAVGVASVLLGLLGMASVMVSHSAVSAIAAGSLTALGFFLMGIMVRLAEDYH